MSDVSGTGDFTVAPPPSDFLVVGLGGSAGSIRSFREFFRNVPADSEMAYVVILHLSPEYESRLAEVLQGSTTIPVRQVRESVKIEPNHVYVIPPHHSLSLADGTLVLSDVTGFPERRAPVDIFFRTLGDSHDARAVCVVLSGTGADGSMGLRRVKEFNGLVLVQDPDEAEFSEMPRNSIATGLVDFVVPVAEMPARILAYRNTLRHTPLTIAATRREEDEQALLDVFTQLRMQTGHDFTNYKRATILRRIERRLAVREIAGLVDYNRLLQDEPAETQALLRELLISVTNFFRDAAVWTAIEKNVVPQLLAERSGEDQLRVWVAGCATGEEAYTLAMILADAAARLPSPPRIQLFATDVDESAIARARGGVYTVAEIADVPPDRLLRYFTRQPDGYRVRRELRELILFAHHNVIKDPPFSHLDLVSCRNLLIYLNRTAQQRALEVMNFGLEPGGVLLLGTAETTEAAGQLFDPLDKEHHIYRSRGSARMVSVTEPARIHMPSLARGVAIPESRADLRHRFAPLDLHQRLLEEYAPPSLVVDDQHNIVHLSDRAGRYLLFGAGEASLNLLQVVRQELRIDLRTALLQAAQKRTTVAARGLSVHTGDREEIVNLIVRPALRDDETARGFFLVLFEPARESAGLVPREITTAEPAAHQLEQELLRIKSQMLLSIEQYEVQGEEARASNEELQATNEELRSTAEELETSQEELQSVNEELRTVNQELQIKIDEISHANDDMRNLMSSTAIGTIFVDRSLRVKLFTPSVHEVFNLIPADVGRSLLDINSKLLFKDLAGDLERVLERLQTIEREVETTDGCWFLMRLLPYRTSEDRIDGVVVTFVDITARQRSEEALRRSSEELEQRVADRTRELRAATGMLQAIVDSSPLAIIAIDAQRHVLTWNASAERMFGVRAEEVMGRPLPVVASGEADAQRTVLDALFGGSSQPVHETLLRRSDGTWLSVSIFPAALRGPDGSIYAVMGLLQDITDRRKLEKERERLLRRIVSGQEEERQRIARELHDELGQHLTALKVGLEALQPPNSNVQRLTQIVGQLDRSIDRLTLELRPPALDDVGLYGAIASLIDQFSIGSGIRVDVHTTGADGGDRLPEAVETALYRVLQEALTNVWKHAGARSVSVIIERHPEQVQLIVEDDGSGFEEGAVTDEESRGRYGLLGMRERVSLIDGSFNIESVPGRGTTVYVRVPLARG